MRAEMRLPIWDKTLASRVQISGGDYECMHVHINCGDNNPDCDGAARAEFTLYGNPAECIAFLNALLTQAHEASDAQVVEHHGEVLIS